MDSTLVLESDVEKEDLLWNRKDRPIIFTYIDEEKCLKDAIQSVTVIEPPQDPNEKMVFRKIRHPKHDKNYKEMQIMLAIPLARAMIKTNHVERRLCRIKYWEDGIITLEPGIKKEQHSIVFGQDTFTYTIKNASHRLGQAEEHKEWEIENNLQSRNVEMIQKWLGNTVQGPEEPFFNLLLVQGEIRHAFDFDADEIYVKYTLDNRKGWREEGLMKHTAYTQCAMARTCSETQRYQHIFELPIEWALLSKDKDPSVRPVVYFEVYSLHFNEQHVFQGYGYLSIPIENTFREYTIKTWKPYTATQIASELIGSGCVLDDISFIYLPEMAAKQQVINRYGLKTVSNGELCIRLNVMRQKRTTHEYVEFKKEKSVIALSEALLRAKARVTALKSLTE